MSICSIFYLRQSVRYVNQVWFDAFICHGCFNRYPAINKPAGVVHWLNNNKDAQNVDWVLILDADQIIRHPITPWALGAEIGKPVAARYG